MTVPSQRARDSIAPKIDHLFHRIRREDGREFTYDDVERGTHGRVSRSYLWKLRHGRNQNPGLDVLEALADFFHVGPEFFFAPSLQDGIEVLDSGAQAMGRDKAPGDGDGTSGGDATGSDRPIGTFDPSVLEVAALAAGLDPPSLAMVASLIHNLHALDASRQV